MAGSRIQAPEGAAAVLDKGFVKLVDFMGGDMRAVESARVSFGGVSKGEDRDRKLLEYLLEHGHFSPFEHSVFQFHIKCPIFVARQWMRHRIACVTGDTELYFDLPGGPRNGRYKSYRMTVEEFHRKWEAGARPIPHSKKPSMLMSIPQRERLGKMLLRNLDEERWEIAHTRVADIFATGEKPVYEVTLEDGRKIRCTQDHRFLFEDGWKTLETATGLTLNNGTAAYKAGLPKLVTNGRVVSAPLYRDKEWLREQYLRPEADDASIAEMLEVSAAVIRKWRKIHGLTGIKSGAHPAWNKGLRYKAGPRVLTDVHLEAIRAARSGPGSNFWKGGVSTRRGNIGRWTTEHARLVFEKNGFRCRACGKTGGRLHAHHIIPVWADIGKARNLDNLTALCAACHRDIHRRNAELDFAAKLEGKPAVVRYRKVSKPRPPAQRLMPVWMRISHIKYLGVRATYDLTVEGPYHNYVANGIVTHNSYNEISARYTEVHDEFYIPEAFRAQDTVNRQGSVEGGLEQEKLSAEYSAAIEASYAAYSALLKAGVAREMARGVLPVSQYTQFYWTINARSLLNFLDLRMHKHAQLEIRRYAEAIAETFKEKMPWTWAAHRRLNDK